MFTSRVVFSGDATGWPNRDESGIFLYSTPRDETGSFFGPASIRVQRPGGGEFETSFGGTKGKDDADPAAGVASMRVKQTKNPTNY